MFVQNAIRKLDLRVKELEIRIAVNIFIVEIKYPNNQTII
jgi:hypothetical protein